MNDRSLTVMYLMMLNKVTWPKSMSDEWFQVTQFNEGKSTQFNWFHNNDTSLIVIE